MRPISMMSMPIEESTQAGSARGRGDLLANGRRTARDQKHGAYAPCRKAVGDGGRRTAARQSPADSCRARLPGGGTGRRSVPPHPPRSRLAFVDRGRGQSVWAGARARQGTEAREARGRREGPQMGQACGRPNTQVSADGEGRKPGGSEGRASAARYRRNRIFSASARLNLRSSTTRTAASSSPSQSLRMVMTLPAHAVDLVRVLQGQHK